MPGAPKVTLIPGDGIGPQVMAAMVLVLAAAGAGTDWDQVEAGTEAAERYGTALPEQTLAVVRRHKIAIKGPLTNPGRGRISPNLELRTVLDCFVNVRSARHYPPGGRSRFPGLDVTIVRDTTEDLGRGPEQVIDGGAAGVALKVITRAAVERLTRFACRWTLEHGQSHITVAHQALTQRSTDGLFMRTALRVAGEFPGIRMDEEAMDGVCMHLAVDPTAYQVLLAPNLYGGILCGLASGLAGSVGLMPGAVFGDGTALFEPGHGSAPKYAGLDKANPTAAILSGAMLLDYLGQQAAAERVRGAVAAVIAAGRHVTYDLGGTAGTQAMAAAICAELR